MLERPPDVSDEQVLALVRGHWEPRADAVEHLPVGWGAHHWRVDVAGEPVLFATLDPDLPRHTHASLEAAYGTAARLGLDFVWPSLPTSDGTFTVPVGARTASATGWLEGHRPTTSVPELPEMLVRLHAVAAPPGARTWSTELPPDLRRRLDDLLSRPWDGPFGPEARALVHERSAQVADWVREHAALLRLADPEAYVVTHGEPGQHNQWVARGRTWLLDWESLVLAPRERDLATLVRDGHGVEVGHDPRLVRLFDLEWRLGEIWSFSQWLQAPHVGDADDRTALGGLAGELTRPHFDEAGR